MACCLHVVLLILPSFCGAWLGALDLWCFFVAWMTLATNPVEAGSWCGLDSEDTALCKTRSCSPPVVVKTVILTKWLMAAVARSDDLIRMRDIHVLADPR